ncbi:MAG: nitrile hydratase subunit alpha [Alphaproteobacteria bacterium]|nr:nitrile hydratase subunit alpha [Alphaproteobacteria bacterium]
MSDHHHGHSHGVYDVDPLHHHPPQPDLEDTPLTHHQIMQMAVAELLIEKEIISAEELRKEIDFMDSITPVRGSKLVARAWTDNGFKDRLIADSKAAATELDMDIGPIPILVMENTPQVHNLIVCTLCSCYPRMLLGIPPDWYKSRSYRRRAISEPRKVLSEFGTDLSNDVQIKVHDSTADMRYMVLPMRPEGSDDMSEEDLAGLVTRDCMIGVALPGSASAS